VTHPERLGDGVLAVSAVLDASLESTTKLTSFDKDLALEPEVADRLVQEAFSRRGATLDLFAGRLGVTPDQLAVTIMKHVPDRPTRSELVRLLAYVVPNLNS
jgi:hypothetical protein